MADSKANITAEIVPVMNKITDHKLNWTNYMDWSKTVRMYLLSIEKEEHLTEAPPKDDSKKAWARADARLFLQIQNSIDSDILPSVSHCNTVKELMDYLEFLYSGKGNITRIHDVCKGFYRAEQQGRSLKTFYMDFKQMYEELKMLMPPTTDLQAQVDNMEKQAIISFLTALDPAYETVRSQILSSSELPSLQDVYSRVLRADSLSHPTPTASALAGRGPTDTRSQSSSKPGNGSLSSIDSRNQSLPRQGNNPLTSGPIVCFYCKEPGHTKRYCRKLQNKLQRSGAAHMAQSSDPSHVAQSSDASPTPSALVTGNCDSCLATASSKWIIDSGATDHMTGNHHLFSTYAPYANPTSITIANGSSSRVLGSGTVTPTPSVSLSSVLNVPDLAFNLLSPSKLTRQMNCFISLFPDHCLIQDLTTKRIIGRGYEAGGHYFLADTVPRSVACSGGSSPFDVHCRLGHLSLSSLKKLYPQFHNVSSLECESCQFAKHHRVHLTPRVNKRAASPFDLVHSDVWGPCPVVSMSGFKYFVTFVDDFSRTTWLYLMKSRSELFSHFCNFCAEIKTQFGVSVKTLRSDNA